MENVKDYVVKSDITKRAVYSKKIVPIQEPVLDQKDFIDNSLEVNSPEILNDVEPAKTEIIIPKNQGKIFSEDQAAGQVIYRETPNITIAQSMRQMNENIEVQNLRAIFQT